MRKLHIGNGPDSYAEIGLSDALATKLLGARILYECGDEPGDHDLHIAPDQIFTLGTVEALLISATEAIASSTAEVKGLPVAGYKATQSPKAIQAVNRFKEIEERALREIDYLGDPDRDHPDVDPRWLSIGRTQLQQAFMALNRAIFQPGRVKLSEDA